MNKHIATALFCLTCNISIAGTEQFLCKFDGNNSLSPITIDVEKKEIRSGEDERYDVDDIRQHDEEYVTAYSRTGYTNNVGGSVMIFDRKKTELHVVELELLVKENNANEKYINVKTYIGHCKAK